jgi:RHS repeat-associated protein
MTTDQYDAIGNRLSVTDRNGNKTASTYDALNRLSSRTDALGNTTSWQYDPAGNLITLTDANLHGTHYSYDPINRPHCETYADGTVRCYTFDPANNLIRRQDAISGQTVTYSYSDLYFLSARSYTPSGAADTFTYDLSGRMLANQRVNGAFTWPESFTYDGANRLLTSVQDGRTVSYSYNIPGRVRALTYPGGRTITEHTDARTRLDHIDDAASPLAIVQYAYDPANNILSRNYRNGTTSAFTYNANNWALSIAHQNPTTFAGFTYAYDNEGNKQYELKSPNASQSECHSYDTTYRLTGYQSATPGSPNPCPVVPPPAPPTQIGYSLDPVGNWNSKTTNGVTQTRTHNSVNEITAIGATPLSYDSDGDLINDGVYLYQYDEEHRLTCVTTGVSCSTSVGQYQYDALGRRVLKTALGAPTAILYLYDNLRIVEEEDPAFATHATYVYGNYVDEILTMDRGGSAYYYHQNALWSVEAITDSGANPVERYSYDAYGLPSITDGSFNPIPLNPWGTPHSAIGNPWTFTGRQLEEETGLYYFRARHYSPSKGRFLQRDPLDYRTPDSNLYAYVGDNPVNRIDPTGQSGKVVDFGDTAGAGTIVPNVYNLPTILDVPRRGWFGRSTLINVENKWRGCAVAHPSFTCTETADGTDVRRIFEDSGVLEWGANNTSAFTPGPVFGWAFTPSTTWEIIRWRMYRYYDVTFQRVSCCCGFWDSWNHWVVEDIKKLGLAKIQELTIVKTFSGTTTSPTLPGEIEDAQQAIGKPANSYFFYPPGYKFDYTDTVTAHGKSD